MYTLVQTGTLKWGKNHNDYTNGRSQEFQFGGIKHNPIKQTGYIGGLVNTSHHVYV